MSIRSTYLIGFIMVSVLLLSSIYFQLFKGIMPCPLCTLQRISFGILGALFLIGMVVGRRTRFAINLLCFIIASFGIVLASRQIWLQNFVLPGNTECGVSLQYMLQVLPLTEVMQKIFAGSTECSERGWEFLHLNMAEWALIWFVAFVIMSICLFLEDSVWGKRK